MKQMTISERADTLHREAVVWDMVWPLEPWAGNDFAALDQLIAAGRTLMSLSIAGDNHNISEAVQRVASARREVLSQPDKYVLVESVDDVCRAKTENKLAVAFHFEGWRCIERNLDMIETYYKLGVRHNLLAFNQSNSVGGGSAEQVDGGLTRHGRRVVAEMERVGMLVDLAHTGRVTSMQAIDMATKPLVFSHVGVNAIHQHWRNVTDEMIKACAQTGGLIGVAGSSMYLGDPACSSECCFRHIDYLVEMVGDEHVGLGTDVVHNLTPINDFLRARPEEWPDVLEPQWPGINTVRPHQVLELVELMLNHGYEENAVRNILGENYLRICSEVWI